MPSLETTRADEVGRGRRDDGRPQLRRPITPLLTFGIVPLVTYVLATAGATALEHNAPPAYYQTVAFLIPTMLITLALQGQFFHVNKWVPPGARLDGHPRLSRAWTGLQRWSAVALVVYLASGELASLYALAAADSGSLLFGITAGSVITAFIAVIIIALIGTPWAD